VECASLIDNHKMSVYFFMYISVTFINLFSVKVVDDSLTVKMYVIVNLS